MPFPPEAPLAHDAQLPMASDKSAAADVASVALLNAAATAAARDIAAGGSAASGAADSR
eukprot:CAMPEP_0176139580 /NCGR_PEP_ID=MMETSP0120_2-20121206/70924_1 /TAXON_ID=160619 /ORGANISM="Kryptoperidinium foliaceum, Strain CCMP 1326" /LENGTH=58 /DNA_ID=CAMNT_0017475581 /DNA_START=24 /DNA_END=196 /DNA_ORIENTATION=+